MGSAAFLNEAINQLAEAYLEAKQKELGESIPHDRRAQELQKVKMYIADRNVYGIDLNPVAVELGEVSLWLNTIFAGGYVPWFGTQLVCGNSLIGARRQVYHKDQLSATGSKWYQKAPERVPTDGKRKPRTEIYHFFTGDEGMSDYRDRVIRSLAEEEINTIRDWRRAFTRPFTPDEIQTALRLSDIVDQLWDAQVRLRKDLRGQTLDPLTVYGQPEQSGDIHTTIRQKDAIYKSLYLSEDARNAGPYARLKFAMDYWCALWFWPIDQAELLPTRAEFLFDMSLILEGTIHAAGEKGVTLQGGHVQMSMFPSAVQQMALDILDMYSGLGVVDLPALCARQPRLALVKQIAEQNRFLHWELEFADLFAERGGFDLIVGNPPWVLLGWNEKNVLSDKQPLFYIKELNASETSRQRTKTLTTKETTQLYLSEYVSMTSQQNYFKASHNFPLLTGVKANLYKCFLPQAWLFTKVTGVSAYLHPDGVYDDPSGGMLREALYPRLRYRFQFQNEKKLFPDIGNRVIFTLSIYSNKATGTFDMISNLFDPITIDQSYDYDGNDVVGGIKDAEDNWNIIGHADRIITISKPELLLFARLFDGSEEWNKARLPSIHAQTLVEVLQKFTVSSDTIESFSQDVFIHQMWNETASQIDGTIIRDVGFPKDISSLIYSGPHIGQGNPLFQASKPICETHRAFDSVDLTYIDESYLQRCNYRPACDSMQYNRRIPKTNWGQKYNAVYRIVARKMIGMSGERTLISSIISPLTSHTNALLGFAFRDEKQLLIAAGMMNSITHDFLIRTIGKPNLYDDNAGKLPIISSKYDNSIIVRALLLNCLNKSYSELWKRSFKESFRDEKWSNQNIRLDSQKFSLMKSDWDWHSPLRTDFERRQALIELDVLTSLALGLTLQQLKTIYRIQFPVLQSYESDTWYDQRGRIVFTNNRSLSDVGFSRPEWNNIKDMTHGTVTRTIIDDTQPGGPVERVIEYMAPFDRCDREQDYETAWKYFARKGCSNEK